MNGVVRRSSARSTCRCVRVWRVRMCHLLAVTAVALGCAACNATGATGSPPMLAAAAGDTPVITFESIEGPPDSITTKLANRLSEEANARQVAMVPRGAPANYRIRAYVATTANRKHSELNWVWDVYTPNQQRALRISGEERITGTGQTAWASADDAVIRKIAHTGMDRLASYLHAPARETKPPPAAPPPAASAVAMVADR